MFASLNNLYQAESELRRLSRNYIGLYERLKHVVSLTRQLQIPYKYLGEVLVKGEAATPPPFIRDSVLELYLGEVQQLKEDEDIDQLLRMLNESEQISYSQVFLLVLGAKPEFIQVNTIIK
ncbi:hypothetical protein [Gracilibacillus alcaliphilus]|uniref:hypothetical protein n=1 Tax=Gracilibacillus alcaliphilus TaxID=1401441 RepID=UPI001EF81C16|nr:hypothetical protein [Gracilibacillus alcaliphilus]MBM7676739.1 hypothetical protein [Gracilibacillus alcaliphilus]